MIWDPMADEVPPLVIIPVVASRLTPLISSRETSTPAKTLTRNWLPAARACARAGARPPIAPAKVAPPTIRRKCRRCIGLSWKCALNEERLVACSRAVLAHRVGCEARGVEATRMMKQLLVVFLCVVALTVA